MHGKNPIAAPRTIVDGFLVKEMFYTIQGEGPWAGYPAIFLRLAGCCHRCFFCDTDFSGGVHASLHDLVAQIEAMRDITGCCRVVITGGEPMLQAIGDLIMACPGTIAFQVETAGAVMPLMDAQAWHRLIVVVSPKTPIILDEIRKRARAWKYIIRAGETDEHDGLPNCSTQMLGKPSKLARPPAGASIYVQPCDEGNDEAGIKLSAANIDECVRIAMKHNYRMSLQLHKLLGLP